MKASTNIDFSNAVLNNFMELFFSPEVMKRNEQGLIKEDFILTAAQVIFFPNTYQPVIRLNEEVSANIKLKKGVDIAKKDVDKESGIMPLINEVQSISLNKEQDLNCGHATLILLRDGYQLSFDFQYNKLTCKAHLQAAIQFLKTSKYALDNMHVFAFIDTAYSTIELLAKTNLLLSATLKGELANHKAIKSSFNQRMRHSTLEIEKKQREIFNKLSEERKNARYLDGEVNIESSDLHHIYLAIEQMYNQLSEQIRE